MYDWLKRVPEWWIAPAGADFMVVLLTDGMASVGLSLIKDHG